MNIILISGKARHGKDTVGEMLGQYFDDHKKTWVRAAYGDAVKFVAKTYFHWDGQKDEAGRRLLQWVGTDKVRHENPDFWTDFVINLLDAFYNEWENVIITDCRFPNEIQKVKDHFLDKKRFSDARVLHFRVVRPDYDNGLTDEQKSHPSETALDTYTKIDRLLDNFGTLEDLRYEVQNTAWLYML